MTKPLCLCALSLRRLAARLIGLVVRGRVLKIPVFLATGLVIIKFGSEAPWLYWGGYSLGDRYEAANWNLRRQ